MNSPDRLRFHRPNRAVLAFFAALCTLLVALSPAAWGQNIQAKFDIQLTGDQKLSDVTTFEAEPGQTVVIELFASGYGGSFGTEAIFQASSPNAIVADSPAGSNAGGPYMLTLNTIYDAGKMNLTLGGFSGVSETGDGLKYLGSLSFTLAPEFEEFTITLTSLSVDKTLVTLNQTVTVKPYVRVVTFSADLNPLMGNQERLKARVNPAGRFPVQVFATGLENATAFEIHIQFDPDAIDAAKTGFAAALPFVAMPSPTGGLVTVEDNTLIVKSMAAEGVSGATPLGVFSFLTTPAFRGSELTFTKVVFTEGETEKILEPALVLKLGSVLTDAPIVTRPPVPVTVTDTRAIIMWETNKPATGEILYGTDPTSLNLSASEEGLSLRHQILIEGLQPSTLYFFQVTATDAEQRTSDHFPPVPTAFYTRQEDTTPPRIVQGPAAFGRTPTGVQIVLRTDEAATIAISYGTSEDALTETASQVEPRVEHWVPLTGLESGVKYFYKVTATDLNNLSFESPVRSFVTLAEEDTRPPVILGRPTVLGRSINSAVIGWRTDEPSNSAVFYGITKGELADSVVVDDEYVRGHRVPLANLLADTLYYYQVRSADGSGNARRSATFSFRTTGLEDTTPPRIVRTPIVPKRGDTEALIVWETNEPATHVVQFATTQDVYADETGTVGQTVTLAIPTRRPEVLLTNLEKGTVYYYKVMSTDLSGNGPTSSASFSLSFATRTRPDEHPPVVFGRPVAVGITAGSAIITWAADEPHSALVEYRQAGGGAFTNSLEDIDLASAHAVTLSGLELGTVYEYRVTATDAAGNDRTTPVFKFKTLSEADEKAPDIVRGPVARNITATSATVYWVTDEPADSRVIYGLSTDYTETVEDATGTRVHSVTLTDLTAGTVYHYAVGSADQAGNLITTDAAGTVLGVSADHKFRTRATEDTQPPVIIEGPDVIIRKDRAVIRWRTDEPATSRVVIGVPPEDPAAQVEGAPVFGEASQLVFEPDNNLRIKHRVVVTGLEGGVPYRYIVSSTDASGNTITWTPPRGAGKFQPPGGFGSFTTTTQEDTQFPVITRGPTVVAATSSSLTIEWGTDEASNSAVNFGSSADALESQEVAGDTETTHRMALTKLAAGTTYAYKVASTDISGNGATESQVAYGTTAAEIDLTAPVIASDPEIIYKTDRQATVRWVTNEFSDAEVAYGTSQDELLYVRTDPDYASEHTVTLTNLDAGATYYYRVSSKDQSNNGPVQSPVLSFTTESAPDTQPPVITDVVAVASDSTAVIAWKTDELSDSAVRFGTSESSLDFNVGEGTDVTEHRIVLSNLTPGTTYTFTVESIDRSDNKSDASAPATFTTLAAGQVQTPDAPTGLTATAGNAAVKLAWTASASAGVTGYTVERAAGGGEFAPIATLEPVAEYVDATVQNGTSYRYRLMAVGLKQAVSDPTSATDAVTPAAGSGPGAPTLFVVQGNPLKPTMVINNSTPMNAGDRLTYTFQVSTQADFSDAVTVAAGIASGAGVGTGDPPGITAWTVDKALQDGTTYYWRAKSSDGTFDSAYLTGSFTVNAKAPQYPGDFSGDMAVNFVDFLSFIGTFNKQSGQEGFNADADFDGSGGVNFVDFLEFIKVYNKQYIRGTGAGKPVAAAVTYGIDASTQLQLVGRAVSSEKDAELSVDVMVASAEDLRGYGLRIAYDPAVLQFLEATDGGEGLLKTDGRRAELFGTLSHDAEKGEMFIAGAITSGAPVDGDGRVARLRFRLLEDHPQGNLMHIAEGLLIDGKLGINTAQNLGGRLNLIPRDFALEHNYPNPFNPETTIRYAVPEAGKVAVRIYNVLGQEVVTLVDKAHQPGFYAVRWNGQDRLGRAVASGVYLYRMDAGAFSQVHKMLLLK